MGNCIRCDFWRPGTCHLWSQKRLLAVSVGLAQWSGCLSDSPGSSRHSQESSRSYCQLSRSAAMRRRLLRSSPESHSVTSMWPGSAAASENNGSLSSAISQSLRTPSRWQTLTWTLTGKRILCFSDTEFINRRLTTEKDANSPGRCAARQWRGWGWLWPHTPFSARHLHPLSIDSSRSCDPSGCKQGCLSVTVHMMQGGTDSYTVKKLAWQIHNLNKRFN